MNKIIIYFIKNQEKAVIFLKKREITLQKS